jgi:hypothetical protein
MALFAGAVSLCFAGGCLSEGDVVADIESAQDELSAARMLVVGPIAHNETKDIPYTASPKYRAYQFHGTKDADVTFTATAVNGAQVRIYLLANDSRTLKSSVTGTLTAHLSADADYKVAVATVDSSSTLVRLGFQNAPATPLVQDTPVATCRGDITSLEAQAIASRGSWLTLTHHAYTRRCDEKPAKSCAPWAQDDSLRVRAPRQEGNQDLHQPLSAKLMAANGAVAVRVDGTPNAQANVQTTGTTSKVELRLNYPAYEDVCDAMGFGGGAGSGGCWRSHREHFTLSLPPISGVVTESCARLTGGVVESNVEEFGAGVRSYLETTHYWSAD